ncbi:MAG: T9SS type A sorting domain-containing protein [Bacteroidetes bacterium]|nr:T9SS type A sorting domain-containing protein [Bacteroidota bacterium]MCW5896757.1 T9SS type A sorting domain-containing protein [Bacteroidota bacterium]
MVALPVYQNQSWFAQGVSGDGSLIVGYNPANAIRWVGGSLTVLAIPQNWNFAWARKVSDDGSVIVGMGSNADNRYEALMWINGSPQPLGYLAGGNSSVATNISPDGSVIVGDDRLYYSPTEPYSVAFRRINGGGLQSLGTGGYYGSTANGVSEGGAVIVGSLTATLGGSPIAARWTQAGGWEVLQGVTSPSRAFDVSADGNTIVGTLGNTRAFIWDPDSGARDLQTVLENEYNLNIAGWTLTSATAVDSSGSVIVGYGNHGGFQEGWWVRLPGLRITEPRANRRWIAGQKDTITWSGGKRDQVLEISYSVDGGTTFDVVDYVASGDTGRYVWDIPRDILSKKCMIRIMDFNAQSIVDTSEVFKIKGYVLTRDSSGQYEPFRPGQDQWAFSNTRSDMFPPAWYQQFDYQGTDPFINSQYSQWQGNFVFAAAISAEFPDWVSWVNTFSVDACYVSTTLGIYSPTALAWWNALKKRWFGSCFGIAVSNALAFSYRQQFQSTYPNFPPFLEPVTLASTPGVKTVVNELYTHQIGDPHITYTVSVGMGKTPTETLNELKEMLIEDTGVPRTLTIRKNSGSGGHAVLPYRVDRDPVNPALFHVSIYDNTFPTSDARIWLDTAANGGSGTWFTPNWPTWGGNTGIFLMDPAVDYLVDPILPKQGIQHSPFVLADTQLQILGSVFASTRIRDSVGNITGYDNDTVYAQIPGSTPLIMMDGSETPPYGYVLPTGRYSVSMSDFTADTVKALFATGNKVFSYTRSNAAQNQTDRLFFDNGVSVVNPDQFVKSASLVTIINETAQEKLFSLRSLELAQNDSVRIENPDSNRLKLISYGPAKEYDIELHHATGTGLGRFVRSHVSLPANTSHIFVPDWSDITHGDLIVYVDIGNNGTIDDTLELQNQATGIGDDQGSALPNEYRLEQNYPNPFNPTTTIRYSLTPDPSPSGRGEKGVRVLLKVYDLLGREVATLVNEVKAPGRYSVTWDAGNVASGVYYYKLMAGSFNQVKKMLLVR